MAESPDSMFNFDGGARVTSANTFVLKGLGDGTYMARLWGHGKDCYIKDVQYAGSSALEDGFAVKGGAVGTLKSRSVRAARAFKAPLPISMVCVQLGYGWCSYRAITPHAIHPVQGANHRSVRPF